MSPPRVIVVGGGPAGMLAAGKAAEAGARVTLLERGPRLGRKLRLTGKGRCNLTNAGDRETFIRAFEPNGAFLYGVFARFFREELLELLGRYGVQTKTERGGRIFPVSDTAQEVATALERWLHDCRVDVRLDSRVRRIVAEGGRVSGVDLYHGRMDAAAVVIGTGGLSYPGTGSTGDGYAMAAELGHTVVPPAPALAPLLTRETWPGELAGLTLKNVRASLIDESSGRMLASEFGEMLFTHTGVSGPIVLTLSRSMRSAEGRVTLRLDLKPALTEEKLMARFQRELRGRGLLGPYLRTLLPRSMADLFPSLCGVDAATRLSHVTAEQRRRIVAALKGLEIGVAGTAPIEEAIVTAGGVALGEVDPRTLMSRRVSGLFFAGEVLDLDAVTGGFNLQAAFSTGAVAGMAAARFVLAGLQRSEE